MPSNEIKLFIVLLTVLAALVVYRISTKEEPRKVRELTFKPAGIKGPGLGNNEGTTRGILESGKKIEITPAGKEKKGYSGVRINLFKPLFPPPLPLHAVLPKTAAPAPSPLPAITASAPSIAQTEAGKFKFLGLFQKDGDRKIFLSREKELFIVKRGDSVGLFQIGDITENTATLIEKDTKEEFRISIKDAKPTNPGIIPGG